MVPFVQLMVFVSEAQMSGMAASTATIAILLYLSNTLPKQTFSASTQ